MSPHSLRFLRSPAYVNRFSVVDVACLAVCVAVLLGLSRREPISAPPTVRDGAISPQDRYVSATVDRSAHVRNAGTKTSPSASIVTSVRRIIGEARALNPTNRGAEDDLRCELSALLDRADAETIVRALSDDEAASEFGALALSRWAAQDVLSAALWLAQRSHPSPEQIAALSPALVKDPLVTDVLGEQLEPGSWREELLAQTARAAAPTDPERALTLAHRLVPGPARTQMLTSLADETAQRDPVAAARWISAEADDALRDALFSSAAIAQTSTDPLGAIEWVLSRFDAASSRDDALDGIVATWASYAPAEAARFATLTAYSSSTTATERFRRAP